MGEFKSGSQEFAERLAAYRQHEDETKMRLQKSCVGRFLLNRHGPHRHKTPNPGAQKALDQLADLATVYYEPVVEKVARKVRDVHIAEDIVQDAFLQEAELFTKQDRPALENPTGYHATAIEHARCDYIRVVTRAKEIPQHAFVSEEKAALVPDTSTPDPVQRLLFAQTFNDAIEAVKPEYRDTLLLNALGYAYQDIATMTNQKLGTVQSRLSRARESLKPQGEKNGI